MSAIGAFVLLGIYRVILRRRGERLTGRTAPQSAA